MEKCGDRLSGFFGIDISMIGFRREGDHDETTAVEQDAEGDLLPVLS